MTHAEAIKEVLEQFDSYKSNCLGCRIGDIDCVDDIYHSISDICENNNLICREKLLEAAEELDG
jgi:hypothetical protein